MFFLYSQHYNKSLLTKRNCEFLFRMTIIKSHYDGKLWEDKLWEKTLSYLIKIMNFNHFKSRYYEIVSRNSFDLVSHHYDSEFLLSFTTNYPSVFYFFLCHIWSSILLWLQSLLGKADGKIYITTLINKTELWWGFFL